MIMLTKVWKKTLIRIIINNFEFFLQDRTHNEWLTEKAVAVIMRIDAVLISTFMIDFNVWTVYVISK